MKLAGLCLAAAGWVACGEQTPAPTVGTNTNWLAACGNDTDCRAPTSCVCGVCTQLCDTTSDCSEFGTTASCQSPTSLDACTTPAAQGLCLATCAGSADCEAAKDTVSNPLILVDFEQCEDGLYQDDRARGGVMCEAGVAGFAGRFDGLDDRVEITLAPAAFSGPISVSVWVNPATVVGGPTIVGRWYEPDQFLLLAEDANYRFSVALSEDAARSHSAETAARAGEWTHLVGVHDGAKVTLYVDGTMAAEVPAWGQLQATTRPLTIGGHPDWAAYRGLIDEVRVYDRALSPSEVQQLTERSSNQ